MKLGFQTVNHKYMEDIYSFAIILYIFSSSIMKISVLLQVRSTSENLNVFITRDENVYGIL